jgi:hypothetical protein
MTNEVTGIYSGQYNTAPRCVRYITNLPPQSYLKVLQRTHYREKYTLLPQKYITNRMRNAKSFYWHRARSNIGVEVRLEKWARREPG